MLIVRFVYLDRAAAIRLDKSSGMVIDLKALTSAPPVFPSGTRPSQVFVAAPMIRTIWPMTSRVFPPRNPQISMRTWTRTCWIVEA